MSSQERFLKINNIEEEQKINDKVYGRNVPSFFIKPNLDFRPISTKYSFFQMVHEHEKPKEEIKSLTDYSPSRIFYPGDSKPPFSYFAKNIDQETNLRNQFMALQKCDQAVYVPDSKSDLYNSFSNVSSTNFEYKEPSFYNLNDQEKYVSHKEKHNFDNNFLFNNNTRLNNYKINNDKRNNKN